MVSRITNEMCLMMEQMSLEEQKNAFDHMEGYLFCFLYLHKVNESGSIQSDSLRSHVTSTLETVSFKSDTIRNQFVFVRFGTSGAAMSMKRAKSSIRKAFAFT